LADCCSSIGFASIQLKSCLNVFVEVVAAKLEMLQNCAVVTSSKAVTALAMNCEAVEDSQYFKFASGNNTGKLEQLAVGKPSDSISHSWSFKETFQRCNNKV